MVFLLYLIELKFQSWFSTTNQTVFINPHLQVMSLGLLGTQQGKIILEWNRWLYPNLLFGVIAFFLTSGSQCSCDVHDHQWGRWQLPYRPWIRRSHRHQETRPGETFKIFPPGACRRWKAVIWHDAEHHRQGRERPHAKVLPCNVLIWYPWRHGAR